MVDKPGQGGELYRGVALPCGMSPTCLDELAGAISQYERGDLPGTAGSVAFPEDLAIRLFEIVAIYRPECRSTQKEPGHPSARKARDV
jgi:hypothetical protein